MSSVWPSNRLARFGAGRCITIAQAVVEHERREGTVALQVADGDAGVVSRLADHRSVCRLTEP